MLSASISVYLGILAGLLAILEYEFILCCSINEKNLGLTAIVTLPTFLSLLITNI